MVKFILIKSPDEWATTKQACRDELVVYLFFSFHIYIYIYIYTYMRRILCSDWLPERARWSDTEFFSYDGHDRYNDMETRL